MKSVQNQLKIYQDALASWARFISPENQAVIGDIADIAKLRGEV